MSADEKPGRAGPPAAGGQRGEPSSPSVEEVDSAWSDEEELDEDATTVARVPQELMALSRRGQALEKKTEEPEKHEAITARPPPLAGGEASVVVDASHQELPKKVEDLDEQELEDDEEEEALEDELTADDLDAGWDVEEERAAAADVAAGLDADARKAAAEARAAQRKEKSRAKKIAAKEKRKAKSDAIKAKQKKPKKRSTPPPPREGTQGTAPARSNPPPKKDSQPPTSRAHRTVPPKQPRFNAAAMAARRDLNRMILFVALVVVFGALAIGLMRR